MMQQVGTAVRGVAGGELASLEQLHDVGIRQHVFQKEWNYYSKSVRQWLVKGASLYFG